MAERENKALQYINRKRLMKGEEPLPEETQVFANVLDRNTSLKSLTGSHAANNILLSGQELTDHKQGEKVPMLTSEAIISENILCFEKVMDNRLAPYRAIVDAMQNAMTTERYTEYEYTDVSYIDGNGELQTKQLKKAVVKWREVKDHRTRMQAARNALLLMGKDPNLARKLVIEGNGAGGITITADALFANIYTASNPHDALSAYNQMKDDKQPVKILEASEVTVKDKQP